MRYGTRSKRDVHKIAALAGLFTAAVSFADVTTSAHAIEPLQPGRKPNVVLMLADNVGYGDIGAFQGGEIRGMPTPRIDQLAAEGLQLTQFLTEPGCTPSRAGLMLGRYAHRAGLGTIIVGGTPNTLQKKEVTLAELFKSRGYKTFMTGKWHLGGEKQSWPTNQGFDDYRVGVLETTDSTLYRPLMERYGFSAGQVESTVPGIWEGDAKTGLRMTKEYTLQNRPQIEGAIAKAAVDVIHRHAQTDTPFFLFIGWTHTHYPSTTSPEFVGKSAGGPYGDAILELDYRTGQILDAIDQAGIEDNTIVIWISDDGASPVAGPPASRGGSNGIYRGELGSAREGALRTPGMIKWPGKIAPRKTNGMVSIHDFLPTLATIIGAKVPTDRAIDGVDQTDFFLGKREESQRESVLSFIGSEIVAVRYKHFRIYPKQFVNSPGNPSMGGLLGNRMETNSMPVLYNIAQDPAEENNIMATHAFLLRKYVQLIGEYKKTLEKDPNPPAVNLTHFE